MAVYIGIGCLTYNRPKHLEWWKGQVLKYLPENSKIYIATDTDQDRRGVAFRSNECLKELRNCEYIFLFNDDCAPINAGWAEFHISASKNTGNNHFLLLKNTPSIKSQYSETICQDTTIQTSYKDGCVTIDSYNNCGGAFMFLTKKVIEKVGGFNPAYGLYGYEHAGYSKRIHKAGLTKQGEYLSVRGAGEYIYAMDYDHHLPFNKILKHEPSLKNELHLVNDYLKQNKQVFDMDTEIYQAI